MNNQKRKLTLSRLISAIIVALAIIAIQVYEIITAKPSNIEEVWQPIALIVISLFLVLYIVINYTKQNNN